MEIKKQATDNPLIDEIVFQCQQMIQEIVLKDEERANNNETISSIQQSDMYAMVIENKVKFEFFDYGYDLLSKIPSLSHELAVEYSKKNNLIPAGIKDELLRLVKEKFLINYEEQNNYYRMLNGLPDYGEKGIHLTKDEIDMINIDTFDAGKYVHQMDVSEASILYNCGIIDILLEKYPDKKYLKHLGQKRIDPYIARKLPNFSLLYLPTVESTEIYNRFKERLEVNRVYMLKTMYDNAYKFMSDYYDRIIMIMIILQSLDDMVNLAPEYIIRKELFDMRTIQFVFESCGVEFFPDIPLKYQKRLIKNLNRLIKYKSSDKNLIDIASLFGFDNIELFKYYLMKTPIMNPDGTYRHDAYEDPKTGLDVEDLESNYKLNFLKVPLDGLYDDYIRDRINYCDYDTIVHDDIFWNGVYTRDYVRQQILQHEFNIIISKYISVDTVYSLSELAFELIYFINMILYSDIDTSQLLIAVPEISSSSEFTLIDLLITLYSLMYLYNGVQDNIIYDPVQAMAIYGFNFDVDMNTLSNYIQDRGYTLEDLGVSEFQIPKDGILTYNQLMEIYTKNKNIHDHLVHEIINANDKNIYDIYMKIYNSLMITKLNFNYFRQETKNGKEPKTYKSFLSTRNSVLYNVIEHCRAITKENERRNEISKYINYIVEDIYMYIDKDKFRYIFQNIPTVSMDYIRTYLFKVINFFKSYKVDMVHTNNIYVFDDKLQNRVTIIDKIIFQYIFNKSEKIEMEDYINLLNTLNPKDDLCILDKIYIDLTWWVKINLRSDIPVNDEFADILVSMIKKEYISVSDGIYGRNYIYNKSLVVSLNDIINNNININIKDKYRPEDHIYLSSFYN